MVGIYSKLQNVKMNKVQALKKKHVACNQQKLYTFPWFFGCEGSRLEVREVCDVLVVGHHLRCSLHPQFGAAVWVCLDEL